MTKTELAMKEHKFVGLDSGVSTYSARVFCEYCGLIAYDANRKDLTERGQREAKEECPRAPTDQCTAEPKEQNSGEKTMHIRTDLDESGKAWIQNDERRLPI